MSRSEFSQATKRAAYERSGGYCECGCGQPFTDHPKERPQYDHELPDFLGGTNDLENCKVIRACCHVVKTIKEDTPKFAKVRREEKRRKGIERSASPLPGGRKSKWKIKVGGGVVPR